MPGTAAGLLYAQLGRPDAITPPPPEALKLDPRHVPTLALLGSAAIGYWCRLLAEAPPDGDLAASVRDSIAKVRGC